jgi:hypothetical protein
MHPNLQMSAAATIICADQEGCIEYAASAKEDHHGACRRHRTNHGGAAYGFTKDLNCGNDNSKADQPKGSASSWH